MITFNQVFTRVKKSIKSKYPNVYCVSERINSPSELPCVWVVEMDSTPDVRYLTLSNMDNQRKSTIEVQAFSNLEGVATEEVKGMVEEATKAFALMGYRCITSQPISNYGDVSIKRYVARYTRIVADEDTLPVENN